MYVLYDIGKTKMRVAVSSDLKKVDQHKIVDTPERFSDTVALFKEIVTELVQEGEIEAIAGGSSRLIDIGEKVSFKSYVEQIFNVDVFSENDAAMAGLGEAVLGAGKHADIVMYMTISTGVGGARIVDGQIDQNTSGFEPGNQILDISSAPHTLEGLVSGTAVERRFDRKAKEVVNESLWEELAEKLAYGIHNSIVHWSPEIVVLGGSMILGSPAIPIDRIEFHLGNIVKIFPKIPHIVAAEFGDLAGIYGALVYMRQKVLVPQAVEVV